jgi:exodeoxyribonuclease V alpha subunit
MTTSSLESLRGSVERVTFHSESSGFCVLRVNVKGQRDLITVVGAAAGINAGEFIEACGQWINDRTYGLQFKAQELRAIPPSTQEGMEKYLGSGLIKGIGPHFAKKLIKAFGEEVFEVIENQSERLLELPGIGKKRREQLTVAWAEQKVVREIMVFLQSHGVGTARAVRIYKTYGDDAVAKVTENPYRLALDIWGIGFKTADTIAQHIGIPRDSILRARAGVRHVLQEMSGEGHCAAIRSELIKASVNLLEIAVPVLEQAIDEEVKEANLIAESVDGEAWLFLAALYRAELGVARHLQRIMQGRPPWPPLDADAALQQAQRHSGLALSASQQQAVKLALRSKALVITGGPGVGKTTLVNSILHIISQQQVKVALCAPTGRAAKRLSESTALAAKTLHRLLEFDPQNGGFKHGADNPLAVDYLVMDEASMVDVVLMNQVLRAIPDHAALLIVGDVDQLPSVGPGAVLADLLDSGSVPSIRLTEIFRQAATSYIILNAHRINRGLYPEFPQNKPPNKPVQAVREAAGAYLPSSSPANSASSENIEAGSTDIDFYFIPADTPEAVQDKLLYVVSERIPQRFGLNPTRDIQVLVPMQRGGIGARALNVALQARLNPHSEPQLTRFGTTFAPGDKVIQNINNYDKDVFNGDIARIQSIDLENSSLILNFEGREINYDADELDEVSLAYAITIHRAQGSEYPCVVLPLGMQHFMLLERNLLYTGITRGKSLVVIIGDKKALSMAVRNRKADKRLSQLAARLQREV